MIEKNEGKKPRRYESISSDTKVTLIAYSDNDINLLKTAKDLSAYSMVQIEDGLVAATVNAGDAQKIITTLDEFDILKSEVDNGKINTEAEPISKKDLVLITKETSMVKENPEFEGNVSGKKPTTDVNKQVDDFLESKIRDKKSISEDIRENPIIGTAKDKFEDHKMLSKMNRLVKIINEYEDLHWCESELFNRSSNESGNSYLGPNHRVELLVSNADDETFEDGEFARAWFELDKDCYCVQIDGEDNIDEFDTPQQAYDFLEKTFC